MMNPDYGNPIPEEYGVQPPLYGVQPPLIDRREFLRRASLVGLATAAAAALSGGTQPAQAAELGLGVLAGLADRPWTSPRWWPIFPTTAAKDHLPRLIDVGVDVRGPLQEHDVTARTVFDLRTHVLEEGIEKFQYVIDNYPETESYAGYCPPLASAGQFEPEPQAGTFLKETKEGLLVAKHAADPMVPISIEAMQALLARGRWVSVNAPDPNVHGVWMRAAYSINGSTISVTAWGAGYIPIPISQVQEAWVPVNDPLGSSEIEESMKALRERTGSWQLKELNLDVVDYVVAS